MNSNKIPDWNELVPGTRIIVPYSELDGVNGFSWVDGTTGKLATIVSDVFDDRGTIAMTDAATYGCFAYADSFIAQKIIKKNLITNLRLTERRLVWIENHRAVRLYDPTFLENKTHLGPVTCKCGFANADVSASTIVNGNYICYKCRVVEARHRSA